MQQVLACAFEAADFRVIENTVGVPDFTATPPKSSDNSETIAVEVKTSDKPKIPLTQRDLDGIRTPGQTGVLAVLMFPSMSPGWLLVPADSISPRSWEIRHLKMKPQVNVGFDVDAMFHRIMAELEVTSVTKGSELDSWIKAQRHAFHTRNSKQVTP